MLCNDTGVQAAVRCEYLDAKSVTRINRLIGVLRTIFRGNGRIELEINGGRIEHIAFHSKDSDTK